MIVKLLANQIPIFWENIKFAVTSANNVKEKNLGEYLNRLLQNLLSDKAQCFVRLDEARMLTALLVTRIEEDRLTNNSHLYIQCLYSFNKASDEEWISDYDLVIKFAKNLQCKYMTFETRSDKVARIGKLVGFTEKHKVFVLDLGGE